jgi:hypothetical protein
VADSTERLIEKLLADAAPVRRLHPPAIRAALWLVAVGAVIALAVILFADAGTFFRRASDAKLAIELIATLATGIAAALAAFELSLPDRSPKWILLPLLPLAVWIAASGYSCYRYWLSFGPTGWEIGESAHCFAFILAAGLPLSLSLFIPLRRAAPLAPIPTALAGGVAAAAIAAFALQFFHPFDVTFMDLGVHLIAVTIVVLGMAAAEDVLLKTQNCLET